MGSRNSDSSGCRCHAASAQRFPLWGSYSQLRVASLHWMMSVGRVSAHFVVHRPIGLPLILHVFECFWQVPDLSWTICQKTQKAEEQWILDKGFLFAAANGVCSCILAEVSTVKHNSLFVEQCPFETSWDWLLDVHPQKFFVDKVCGNVITYTSSLSSASTAGTWNAALVLLQKMGQAGDLTRRWERCQDPTIFRISDPRSKYQSED